MLNMVSVGIAVIEHAPLPPEADDFPLLKQLSLVKSINQRSYRSTDGGDTDAAGHFEVEQLGDRHIKYIGNSIWPDDLMYGYVYGLARRFLGEENSFVLKYDEDIPRQSEGGDRTVMHLTWESK